MKSVQKNPFSRPPVEACEGPIQGQRHTLRLDNTGAV
jgi:hypothetical protein